MTEYIFLAFMFFTNLALTIFAVHVGTADARSETHSYRPINDFSTLTSFFEIAPDFFSATCAIVT